MITDNDLLGKHGIGTATEEDLLPGDHARITLGEIRERFRVIGSAAASTAGGLSILEHRVVELEAAVAQLQTYAQRELELQTGLLGIQEQLVSRMKTLERRMAGKRAEPK